jgi:hypothetical protein
VEGGGGGKGVRSKRKEEGKNKTARNNTRAYIRDLQVEAEHPVHKHDSKMGVGSGEVFLGCVGCARVRERGRESESKRERKAFQ